MGVEIALAHVGWQINELNLDNPRAFMRNANVLRGLLIKKQEEVLGLLNIFESKLEEISKIIAKNKGFTGLIEKVVNLTERRRLILSLKKSWFDFKENNQMFLSLFYTLLELMAMVVQAKRQTELRIRYRKYFLDENLVTKVAGINKVVSKYLAKYKKVEQTIDSL